MSVNELKERAQELLDKAAALEGGAKLAPHHYNGSDRCYEVYCPGCDKHMRECREIEDIPLAASAMCFECSRSPEERQRIEAEEAEQEKAEARAQLAAITAKYPDLLSAKPAPVEAPPGVIWMDADPSNLPCGRCGGEVREFAIPDGVWNLVMRPHGKEGELPEYICLGCWHERLLAALQSRQVEVPAAFTKQFQCDKCEHSFQLTVASTACPMCDQEACAVQAPPAPELAVADDSDVDSKFEELLAALVDAAEEDIDGYHHLVEPCKALRAYFKQTRSPVQEGMVMVSRDDLKSAIYELRSNADIAANALCDRLDSALERLRGE